MSTKKSTLLKSVLCLIILLLLSTNSVIASDGIAILDGNVSQIQPRWNVVDAYQMTFSTSNSKLYIFVRVDAPSGTTYSNGTLVVTKTSGSDIGEVKTWSELSQNSSIYVFTDNSLYYTRGRYNAEFSIVATHNGVSETITIAKDTVAS